MSTIVETTAGKIEGQVEDELNIFRGIPYAAPPVGDLRWLPPQPLESWTGVRSAASFGSASPQIAKGTDENVPPGMEAFAAMMAVNEPESEDCLYLNIWTSSTDDLQRPVLFWIHGGGFIGGAGSQSIYNGSVLCKRGDMVVVTINYRMGPFGFLNLNEVTNGAIPATGNEGLLDQIAALEWVRDNIADFGGDPGNVTIFGESAGGISAACLLAMPRAKGLFHKAIDQSGPYGLVHSLNGATRLSERFLDACGFNGNPVEGLRSATTSQLVDAALQLVSQQMAVPDPDFGRLPMKPVVDGKVLPVLPVTAVADGAADGIPLLVGSTRDEMKSFGMAPEIASLDEAGLVSNFQLCGSDWDVQGIVDAYRDHLTRQAGDASPPSLFVTIETDRAVRMPAVRLVEAQRKRQHPAYHYMVTWSSPLLDGLLGAMHAIEIGFLFGTYKQKAFVPLFGSGPAADLLAKNIQDAWLTFARTGDPSCEGLGTWPLYGDKRETMILGDTFGVETILDDEIYRVWEPVPDTIIGWN